jgi:hypothetical protein
VHENARERPGVWTRFGHSCAAGVSEARCARSLGLILPALVRRDLTSDVGAHHGLVLDATQASQTLSQTGGVGLDGVGGSLDVAVTWL